MLTRVMLFPWVFWQVAHSFAGCFWRDYIFVVSMFGNEPGFSPPRQPRGFRRRWIEKSAASVSNGASPAVSVAHPLSELDDCMADRQSDASRGFEHFNSWMYIPDGAADVDDGFYEPESPVDTLLGDAPAISVSGPAALE